MGDFEHQIGSYIEFDARNRIHPGIFSLLWKSLPNEPGRITISIPEVTPCEKSRNSAEAGISTILGLRGRNVQTLCRRLLQSLSQTTSDGLHKWSE